jgi:hypothetical protein
MVTNYNVSLLTELLFLPLVEKDMPLEFNFSKLQWFMKLFSLNKFLNLREIELGDMNWINLAEDTNQWLAVVNTIMSRWVP